MKHFTSSLFSAILGGALVFGATEYYRSTKTSGIGLKDSTPVQLVRTGSSAATGVDFTEAAEKSLHAVVHIKTIVKQVNNLAYDPFAELFFGPQRRQQTYESMSSGSGVIISENGYIVTNNHVIANASEIEVTLNDKRVYKANLVGADPSTDVAVLKIDEKDLPFLAYGNSDAVKVGEWALAVGNPFNLYSTVTAGIISAKGRNNILNGNNRLIESFIQTDAAVNPGNSGGALVNTMGELIGINTAIASNNGTYQGYAFAVPVNIVKKVVSDLVEFGTVQRAYIGINVKEIDARFAAEQKIKQIRGIYVSGLLDGGSAADAGIKEGDIITAIQQVPVNSFSELQEQVSRYRPGDKISVTLERGGKELNLPVILKTFDNTTKLVKKNEMKNQNVVALGASLATLSDDELLELKTDAGVRIDQIGTGKLAQVGIQEGFIITAIDKKKVDNATEVKKILETKRGSVLIEGFYTNGMRASYSFGI